MADKPETLLEPDFTIQVNDEPDLPVYTASTLREAVKGARKELLTMAVELCERISVGHRDAYKGRTEPIDRDRLYNPHTDGCSDGAFDCAETLRKLMEDEQ